MICYVGTLVILGIQPKYFARSHPCKFPIITLYDLCFGMFEWGMLKEANMKLFRQISVVYVFIQK